MWHPALTGIAEPIYLRKCCCRAHRSISRRGIARLRHSNPYAPVSSLDHLRKQAKLDLRWYHDRYFPVAARIRSLLPRFAETSDIDILASPFRLSDAQELVARKSGFQSWPALVKGLEAMSSTAIDTVAPTIIIAAEPQILVTDFDTACAFYCNKLGFRCAFAYGEPTFYG